MTRAHAEPCRNLAVQCVAFAEGSSQLAAYFPISRLSRWTVPTPRPASRATLVADSRRTTWVRVRAGSAWFERFLNSQLASVELIGRTQRN